MKKLLFIISFIAVIIATNRSLIHPEFFRVHDFVHGARIAEMSRALLDGHFPVRWTQNFGYGYGMPLFEFYAPLPYYVGSLFYLLTGQLILSVKLLWLIPSLLSFYGAYRLGNRLYGPYGGIVAGILFSLASYRGVDLYVRGAIGEVWAMAFFPWILDSIISTIQQQKQSWKLLVVSFVSMFLSHNLMTMLFFPFAVVFGLSLYLVQCRHAKAFEKKKVALQLIGSTLLAMGLSTFYLLPAIVEKGFTQVEERILGGYFHYSQHFLYIRQFFKENWKYGGSQWGPKDDISFFFGHTQLFLLVLASSVFALKAIQIMKRLYFQKSNAGLKGFFTKIIDTHLSIVNTSVILYFLFFSVSTFMTLQKSEMIWNVLSPLQVAQFPWRFLSLSIFFIAMIGGWVIAKIKYQQFRFGAVIVILIFSTFLSWKYFVPEFYLQHAEDLYYEDAQLIQSNMSGILPDYIPLGLSPDLPPRYSESIQLISGVSEVTVIQHKTQSLTFSTTTLSNSVLDINIAHYPGWRVTVNGNNHSFVVNDSGLMQIELTEGNHEVQVYFGSTPIRLIADLISLVSMIILISMIVLERRSTVNTI